jgi:hypothetical protein
VPNILANNPVCGIITSVVATAATRKYKNNRVDLPMGITESSKKKFRRAVMWSVLALIILLICLSVYGAFIGAERAQRLVNTLPLTVYWLAFVVILIAGLVTFRRLIRVPSLLLIHAGCVLILTGGMWGSDAGHKLQKQLFGIDKIRTGQMIIYEGHTKNQVLLEQGQRRKELPFSVHLKDFRLEHYKPGSILVYMPDETTRRIPAETGSEYNLGGEVGKVKIVRTFERFRLDMEGNQREAIDAPDGVPNPALEVIVERPDGSQLKRYVFEPSRGYIYKDNFQLYYLRMISDYISELQIIVDNKVVAEKNIEVNHPLHYGGYHFYQNSYDAEAGLYTVLEVTSDTGLNLVYAGYLMLCIGVFWHLWLRKLSFAGTKSKSE